MRLIHVGVGGFGQHWSDMLQDMAGVEVVALVDVSPAALAAACETYGYDPAMGYGTLEEALQAVEADIVLCVTPPRLHREQAETAMAAGLHVICEKPLATDLADCVAMLRASRRTGRLLAVSQNYRYQPDMQALARLVRGGAIGEVGQVKLDFYKGWYFEAPNFRRRMAHPLLVDMSIHHFDLLRFVTGREAVTVRGISWNPPWSENAGDTSLSLLFRLDNEARVVYNASWCAQGDFCNWNGNWLIEGDKGSIVYEQGKITLNYATGRYAIADSEDVVPEPMVYTGQAYVLSRFIKAIEQGTRPETEVSDNLRSMAMVFAAVEAVEQEEPRPVLPAGLEALLGDGHSVV